MQMSLEQLTTGEKNGSIVSFLLSSKNKVTSTCSFCSVIASFSLKYVSRDFIRHGVVAHACSHHMNVINEARAQMKTAPFKMGFIANKRVKVSHNPYDPGLVGGRRRQNPRRGTGNLDRING